MKKLIYVFKVLLILVALLCIVPLTRAQLLNEIFPNPEGDDNNKEFVEILTDEPMNLSGYIIGDESSNDTLVQVQYKETNYSLIVEEGFNWTVINASIYTVGASIGNDLGNTKDSIFLYNTKKVLLDTMSYASTTEGKSIERNATGWYLAQNKNGTPGMQNSNVKEAIKIENETQNSSMQKNDSFVNKTEEIITIPIHEEINRVKISFNGNTTLYTNETYTKLFRIDNKEKEEISPFVNITVWKNNTIKEEQHQLLENISRYRTKDTSSILFEEQGNYTICGTAFTAEKETNKSDNSICANITVLDPAAISCDRNLSIQLNQSVYPNKKQIPIRFAVEGNVPEEIPYEITYSIEEFSGKAGKKQTNTTNAKTKRWTPEIKKEYALYIINAELRTRCIDANEENNHATEQFIVKNVLEEQGTEEIAHVYLGTDNVARAGDSIAVKLDIYTGNLSKWAKEKQAVKVYVENEKGTKVSETTTIALEESYEELTLTVPVLLKYSCSSQKAEQETDTVILEGFRTQKQKISVQGVKKELCEEADDGGEYTAKEFSETAVTSDSITTNITIHNLDAKEHTYAISSKIYRGPKTYAGDFFVNQQKIMLEPGETQNISLENNWSAIEAGTYSTKIQIQKDQQKTMKEFRSTILIGESGEGNKETNQPKIHEVGSLTEEPKEKALLFAEVEGQGEYMLVVDSLYEEQQIPVTLAGKQLVFFNATLAEGKNNIVITLEKNKTQLSTVPLFLYATKENITIFHEQEESNKTKAGKITAMAAAIPMKSYDATFTKATTIINSFLIILSLSFNIYLVKKKQNIYKTASASQNHGVD
ncbi:hypothetical protein HZA99_06475 [Candidatus Woesearchaeota archaeon]|nr:hypothetical protein [Candidatus Woesearchaeota archaeon]